MLKISAHPNIDSLFSAEYGLTASGVLKKYFYWKGRFTDRRDREKNLLSTDSLPRVATKAGAELVQSQEPRAFSRFPT